MRSLLTASFMVVLTAASVPAIAGDKKPVADGEKRVCRSIEKTGSIMPGRKVCHTRTEWAQIDGTNEQNARDASDRNRAGGMPNRTQ